MVKIKEIFASIQGEGPYVGYKQLFVRLCCCNLHCDYCDTEFDLDSARDYSVQDLLNIVNMNKDCHSISFTGGEPLLSLDFLINFIPLSPLPIYLETNGTLTENLKKIINNVDYIASDIKLPSCTGLKPLWDQHDEFLKIASRKNLFVKVVFDNNITDDEIEKVAYLCNKYDIELVLQPKMIGDVPSVTSSFMQKTLNQMLRFHSKTRLIPQVHKFINVE